ncbi:type I-E CRISPR-associated protein Cas6/Cse3/CasE [Streptomyces sp. AJS327]|uniref:type I-E CRISPR-associated protein Cas6/Cse3/CasE n=1 Tax=Streptomyces sp. AJS327 TaxID=2545265 RepID=UPI0015DE788B|nr:type I-E CRISPR-associated protein Cas6/Cse3/CasE [Streptomyces sp. AJS327]MBA0050165.1 type I-E CRISPR-associated protein Cas6/Cse3/CasE [Streptomyces sp. AJS327]
MYLTRFRANIARADARRLFGSPHLLHGAVSMSFPRPPGRDGAGPRVLWRLDHDASHQTSLFIVSPDRPDLTHLVEQAGWPASDVPGWDTYDYGAFLGGLNQGDVWGFRLTANPVHHVRLPGQPEGARTKRLAHRTPKHQTTWLLERQQSAGFEVLPKPPERQLAQEGDEHQLAVRDYRPLRFRRQPREQRAEDVRITRVTFDGRLRITDPELLRRTLTHGLGKAKAYGCGLMTLAPVR